MTLPVVFIACPDLSGECTACGGALPPEPIPSARGSALRYCSVDCHDDWEQHLDDEASRLASAWCPTCGYDRHEHAPGCEAAS